MSGIFLLVVVGLWACLMFKVSKWLGSQVKAPRWRKPTIGLAFTVLLLLPVADEIVGGFQFRALCEKNAVLWIDASKAKGKTVRLEISPKDAEEQIQGTALPIFHSLYSFRVLGSNEEIARYATYKVKGGRLTRALGISNSDAPLTIGRSACSPDGRGMLDRNYGFTLIN